MTFIGTKDGRNLNRKKRAFHCYQARGHAINYGYMDMDFRSYAPSQHHIDTQWEARLLEQSQRNIATCESYAVTMRTLGLARQIIR